jgi:hypothetical protein
MDCDRSKRRKAKKTLPTSSGPAYKNSTVKKELTRSSATYIQFYTVLYNPEDGNVNNHYCGNISTQNSVWEETF